MEFVRLAAHDVHVDFLGDSTADVLEPFIDPTDDESGHGDKVSLNVPRRVPVFDISDAPIDPQTRVP